MKYTTAKAKADLLVAQLAPYCERIEIAGSIRRRKADIGDIEIVAIPLPYETGLFESGLATVVNKWEKVKGELAYESTRYTQRLLEDGTVVDLFFCKPDNWGMIMVYRTGSKEFNMKWLARAKERGYHMKDGRLFSAGRVEPYAIPEEQDLFTRIAMEYVRPENRI